MADWTRIVQDLENEGLLLIQDGNHGEYRPRPNEFGENGVTFIRAADMNDGVLLFESAQKINDIARKRIRKGIGASLDAILSHKGTVGKVAFVPSGSPEFICSPQTTFWRSLNHEVIDPRYLYHYLRSNSFAAQLRAIEHESDMAAYVSLTQQRRLRIAVPPISLQRSISSLLGALDDKIAVNERIIEKISSLIENLYQAAQHEGATRTVGLLEALRITFGAPFASSEFCGEGVGRPLLRIRDLKTRRPQIWTTEVHDKETLIEAGDVVAGMDAEFRPTFWLGKRALLNQRVMHAQSKIGGGYSLAREALRGPLASIESYKTGTTVAHLNKSDLETQTIEIPGQDATASFASVAEPLRLRMVSAAEEASSLASLRDILLPQLMSGRLRVKEAEKIVEDMT